MSKVEADSDAPPTVYLGDAVYASFDGYQIWLTLNDHRNAPLVALEPTVMLALVHFAKAMGYSL